MEKRRLLFLGDIHGKFSIIEKCIGQYDLKNSDIIQLGDFGIGFNEKSEMKILSDLDIYLSYKDIVIYVVRGNHDDPKFFNSNITNFNNIKFVADYSVLDIGGKNILFLGGAVSIDRKIRVKGVSWFEGEQLPFDIDKINSIRGVDIVVSHTSYDYSGISLSSNIVNQFKEYDDKLIDDIKLEKENFLKTFDILLKNNDIKYHYFGHYHFSSINVDSNVKHRVLNIGELYEENEYV